jgi:hypothetical protein
MISKFLNFYFFEFFFSPCSQKNPMMASSILIISEWDLKVFPNMFPKEQKNNKETSYQQWPPLT